MNLDDLRCAHTCRNSCTMLNEALSRETALVQFYERLMGECDYPEVQAFIREMVEERSRSILRIVGKLNELHARTQIM
ncbi:MAG: hypothetical protein WD295_05175, partial [Bacteroidota bacterium]